MNTGCSRNFKIPAPDLRVTFGGEIRCTTWDNHLCEKHAELGPGLVLHSCRCGASTNTIYLEDFPEVFPEEPQLIPIRVSWPDVLTRGSWELVPMEAQAVAGTGGPSMQAEFGRCVACDGHFSIGWRTSPGTPEWLHAMRHIAFEDHLTSCNARLTCGVCRTTLRWSHGDHFCPKCDS